MGTMTVYFFLPNLYTFIYLCDNFSCLIELAGFLIQYWTGFVRGHIIAFITKLTENHVFHLYVNCKIFCKCSSPHWEISYLWLFRWEFLLGICAVFTEWFFTSTDAMICMYFYYFDKTSLTDFQNCANVVLLR